MRFQRLMTVTDTRACRPIILDPVRAHPTHARRPAPGRRSRSPAGLPGHTVPDPRVGGGRRHPLVAILAMAAAAVLTGARSVAAVAEWDSDTPQPVRAALGARREAPDRYSAPSEATIRWTWPARWSRRMRCTPTVSTPTGWWPTSRRTICSQSRPTSPRRWTAASGWPGTTCPSWTAPATTPTAGWRSAPSRRQRARLRLPHAAQVLQVTRKVRDRRTGRRRKTETAYAVTSLAHAQASPARLADLIRGHAEPGHRRAQPRWAGQPRRRATPPQPRSLPTPGHPRNQPRICMNPTSRKNAETLPPALASARPPARSVRSRRGQRFAGRRRGRCCRMGRKTLPTVRPERP
jgi:DDE_Tnp_1-associated